MTEYLSLIRAIPDFPKPGIVFRDVTPLLADRAAFAAAIRALAEPWRDARPDAVAGIEARGFIFGAALARELDTGFVPVRKPGKLPAASLSESYALEYGSDSLQVHADALPAGSRVLLVDDVLATGGTLRAALNLLRRQGAAVVGATVLIELSALDGRAHWPRDVPLHAELTF